MSDRAQRLTDLLADEGVDALLVTDLINLRYLTGFVGTNGLALIGPDIRAFATDFRYVVQAEEQVDSSFDRRQLPRNLPAAVEEMLPAGSLRVGIEGSIPIRIHARLRDELPERVELVPVGGLVERLRAVKEPEEVERIRAAAALADQALDQLLGAGLVGKLERDLALELEIIQRRLGAERVSFEPIVAGGPNGALPHAAPGERRIGSGELVVIDWGAQLDGYCSDCTRTLATGEVNGQAREVYDLVLRAQLAGLEAVRADAAGSEVDGQAREMIDAAGYGEQFGHGLGHGVGLDVHEEPRLAQSSEDQLVAGNVVSVEPGVYLPGRFGVRIEDLVVVGEEGPEILTSVSKEFTVVG